ncbi:hypothetical protein CDL15_Pgr026225 [Punica granatum]|uniref:Uncharacterized protein n=1 Tax=Punica granatum TaxID=22663 RepID=A0A218VSQ9_PUNGR|nr:hypothetical protein CDL15_Pgr026225 [Punica granatum]PKI49437.1 hypothetical protein CRG98_030169 [Punica granatum]
MAAPMAGSLFPITTAPPPHSCLVLVVDGADVVFNASSESNMVLEGLWLGACGTDYGSPSAVAPPPSPTHGGKKKQPKLLAYRHWR